MKPIRDKKDLKGEVRNVQNCPKGQKRDLKETAVTTHFYHGYERNICALYSSHVKVSLDLMKPIRDNEDHKYL